MTAIATIKHNDSRHTDRVTLYVVGGSPWVWAQAEGEEPYETDVAVDGIESAWSGPEWDLQIDEDAYQSVL